jgi:hypothetical protein
MSIRQYILHEVFDSSYPYHIGVSSPQTYYFDSSNGHRYEVIIEKPENLLAGYPKRSLEVSFQDDNEQTDITGQGDAFKILNTVGRIIIDYFTGFNYPFFIKADIKEPSRVSLYNKVMPRVAEELGIKLEISKKSFYSIYLFLPEDRE